jgi:hypothetical protein
VESYVCTNGKKQYASNHKKWCPQKMQNSKKEEKSHFVTSFLNLNEGFFKKPNRQALHSWKDKFPFQLWFMKRF